MANTKSRTLLRPRVIETDNDVRDGVRALRRKCAIMRRVHDMAGHPPLRRRPAGFEGLARIIVGQQVSVASASAIWARTETVCRPFEPAVMLALKDKHLAGAGLSRPKIRTLRAISEACSNGLDLARLDRASDEEVHAALTAVTGIGPGPPTSTSCSAWAAPMAGRRATSPCRSPPSTRWSWHERPDKEEMLELAERWRPWRGVAARLLWAYYAARKAQRTAVPV
jgi:DNA-3-methyladenine glycosylase II